MAVVPSQDYKKKSVRLTGVMPTYTLCSVDKYCVLASSNKINKTLATTL